MCKAVGVTTDLSLIHCHLRASEPFSLRSTAYQNASPTIQSIIPQKYCTRRIRINNMFIFIRKTEFRM